MMKTIVEQGTMATKISMSNFTIKISKVVDTGLSTLNSRWGAGT